MNRFAAEEWAKLTNYERMNHCNFMAKEAIKHRETASRPLGDAYLHLAEYWLRLGMELGREEKFRRDLPGSQHG
jgi:hypothetical protein